MGELLQYLPEEHKKGVNESLAKVRPSPIIHIRCASNAADTAATGINTSILLRRHPRSGFKPEVQQAVLNMLFDKEHLFGSQVDSTLDKMKKDTDIAKAMGAL